MVLVTCVCETVVICYCDRLQAKNDLYDTFFAAEHLRALAVRSRHLVVSGETLYWRLHRTVVEMYADTINSVRGMGVSVSEGREDSHLGVFLAIYVHHGHRLPRIEVFWENTKDPSNLSSLRYA